MEKYRFDPAEFHLMERSSIPLAIYQFIDNRVVCLVLSDGFCDLFGYEREQAYYLMDHDMYRDTHPDDVARIADAAFCFATKGGEYNVVYRTHTEKGYIVIHAYGAHKYVAPDVRIAVVWYNNEGLYHAETPADQLSCGLDLAYSTALHGESVYRANSYDYLTGLPNVSYFFSLAQAGILSLRSAGKQPAIVFFSLNGMKYFNDQHGYAVGNRLITDFAKILVRHFSNENCGNFSADHFAVYTEEAELEDKLREIFAEVEQLNDGNGPSVRAGIYLIPADETEAGLACDRAKYACDSLHGLVSSFCYFDETMLKRIRQQSYIVQNLDRAIEERWIQVHYQPIIRAANGRVCDEEALCRWYDPVEGYLSPAELIPVLEEVNLAYKLDLFVVEQVLEKMQRQMQAGLYLVPQSVNLSRTDFDSCDIVGEVCRRVDDAGIPRDKLHIELTESVIGGDFAFMKEQIECFRNLGFQVWMDDFGSGYSSLDVLQSIHFDLIKFDMRFIQQFHEGEGTSIILTELVRMAQSLGIDTVVEGVETAEHVEFLRDIGCTKLQGYYYCRPLPLEKIMERYRTGTQIGFENPDESEYYAALGKVNLYDLGFLLQENSDQMRNLFDTLPVALLEANDTRFKFTRGNKAFRDKLASAVPLLQIDRITPFSRIGSGTGASFANAVRQCREPGKHVFFDEELPDGSTVHAIIRHVAANPITNRYACVMAMLGLSDASERRVTYTSIAQALSTDYIFLYYVNLETGRFVEYKAKPDQEHLGEERKGGDFFNVSRQDALTAIYPEDVESFLQAFTRENVLQTIDETGAFTLTYRLMINGRPQYASMKAVRMGTDSKHIIIGVNNVDAQMRQQEVIERVRRERMTYHRILALSGNYLCIYTVDPDTDRYSVYSAMPDYAELPIPTLGEDFFAESAKNCDLAVFPEDQAAFRAAITKQNILQQIWDKGTFSYEYRLQLNGGPRRVRIKAALIEEENAQQLIVGIKDIDS